MAVTPDTGDAFIREVDDEYRRARLASFWSRYGRWLVVGVGLLLVLIAAGLYWQALRARDADARGSALMRAQAAGARGDFARLADSPEPGYRALARLGEAGAALKAGDQAAAIKLFDAVSGDAKLAQPYRDFASIRATQLQFDALGPDQVIARMRPLAQPGNAWFGSAGELVAMAYLKQGKTDLALPLFEALLSDTRVPQTIQLRVQQLLASLAPDRLQRLAAKQQRAAQAGTVAAR